MRLRFFGNRAIVLDAASSLSETIPEKLSVAELLQRNIKLWAQGVAPAIANKSEQDVLRAMNRRNKDFWGLR